MLPKGILFFIAFLSALPLFSDLHPGDIAPDFTGVSTHGKIYKLSDLKGKTVVLEWTNHRCPFVIKHYSSGNMQALQKAATEQGVVWLSIASSAPGKQGYTTPEEANRIMLSDGSKATDRILDPSGKIGKLYGAKSTPEFCIIDPEGNIAYMGAIDDRPSSHLEDIPKAKNYIQPAINAVLNGKKPRPSQTDPYGCSIKY